MATDFTNNNTTINSSGAFQPTTRNTPLDVRTRVNLKADIDSIPNPFIGMKILVLQDETNNNEMTEYIVVSLKANSLGIADSKVNEVVLVKDFLGVSGNGISNEQSQQLNTAYTHSQTTHVQQSDIPTKTSELTNDSDYVNSTYVANKIAEASLSGGEVDPSGYVTKETGNANQITFSDGQTFQAKLDAGTLKGEKGEKGDKGDKGDTGETGPQGIQGEVGPQGPAGKDGAQGPQGEKGEKGDKGEQGPRGEKGDTGATGPQGEQGPAGPAGTDGKDGQDGLTTSISVNGITYTHVDGLITLPDYPTKIEEYVTQDELNNLILNNTIKADKVYRIDEKFGIEDYFISIDPLLLQDGVYTLNADNTVTYSNDVPTDTELDLSTTNAVGLIYKGCTNLTKFVANFTTTGDLNNLIFVNCNALQRVHILNCPLDSNKESLLKMINYLPDRNGRAWGSIVIPSNKDLRLELEDKSIEKDWYFGSDILYNETELAKCQEYITDANVLDIWESAEYGEGRRVAICDSGLFMDCKGINYESNVGYFNVSEEDVTEKEPCLEVGNESHGTHVTSTLVGDGRAKYYGMTPKAEWIFIKIGMNGYSFAGVQHDMIKIANENNCDLIQCSFSEPLINDKTILANGLVAADLKNYYNGKNRGFIVYSCGNEYKIADYFPYLPGSYKECMLAGGYGHDTDGSIGLTAISGKRRNVTFVDYMWHYQEYYKNGYIPYEGFTDGRYNNMGGTSACAPCISGKMLLGITLFIKKYGYKPNKEQLVDYMKYRTVKVPKVINAYGVTYKLEDKYQGYGRIDFMAYNENPTADNALGMEV